MLMWSTPAGAAAGASGRGEADRGAATEITPAKPMTRGREKRAAAEAADAAEGAPAAAEAAEAPPSRKRQRRTRTAAPAPAKPAEPEPDAAAEQGSAGPDKPERLVAMHRPELASKKGSSGKERRLRGAAAAEAGRDGGSGLVEGLAGGRATVEADGSAGSAGEGRDVEGLVAEEESEEPCSGAEQEPEYGEARGPDVEEEGGLLDLGQEGGAEDAEEEEGEEAEEERSLPELDAFDAATGRSGGRVCGRGRAGRVPAPQHRPGCARAPGRQGALF